MLKDFPLKLFSSEKAETLLEREMASLVESKTDYDPAKSFSKLTYKYPVEVIYNSETKQPECLTQMYSSSNYLLRQTSCLVPWGLANKLQLGYDLYFNLSGTRHIKTDLEYYIADCKGTLARFYPSLFARASAGKCFYTLEGFWLTPVEFQTFSGSTGADWRAAIQLRTLDTSKAKAKTDKNIMTLKTLIDNQELTVHSTTCTCRNCKEISCLQDQNINLLESFFINSGKTLVLLYPDPHNTNLLKIELNQINTPLSPDHDSIPNILQSVNRSNLKKPPTKQTLASSGFSSNLKQIECQIFDESTDYFRSSIIAEDLTDLVVCLNYNNTKLEVHYLELNETDSFDTKLLYDLTARDDFISCISSSHLIQADCAVVYQRSGDVYLTNEEICGGTSSQTQGFKVASNIQPLRMSLDNQWRSIKFGTQPRQFIYADPTQLISIDSRAHSQSKCLFQPNTQIAEVIERNQVCQNNYFCHLICTSSSLILLDERYTAKPLLKWNHWLNSQCLYLKSFDMFNDSKGNENELQIVVCSDGFDVYSYQFCMKQGMCVSQGFPRKLDSPKDLFEYLPSNYDKRLEKHLDLRLNRPMLGLSSVKYRDQMGMFMMQQNGDLFYECYDMRGNGDGGFSGDGSKTKVYKKWLNSLKSDVLSEEEYASLDVKFQDMDLNQEEEIKTKVNLDDYLVKASPFCKFCNESVEVYKFDVNKECDRCGLSVDFFDEISGIDLQSGSREINLGLEFCGDVNLEDELTRDLYSVWYSNEGEMGVACLDRSKRIKRSDSR